MASSAMALVLGGLALALMIADLPLAGLAHQSLNATGGSLPVWISAPFAVVGFVVAWRKPVVWVYAAVAVCWIAAAVAITRGAIMGHHTQVDPSGNLRHRIQHVVDRRFNRARYDADQAGGGRVRRATEGRAAGHLPSGFGDQHLDDRLRPA